MTTDTVTTHFDYHSIDHNLLKLDILGHDDPTMIRMLQDLTGVDPTKIPLDDTAGYEPVPEYVCARNHTGSDWRYARLGSGYPGVWYGFRYPDASGHKAAVHFPT